MQASFQCWPCVVNLLPKSKDPSCVNEWFGRFAELRLVYFRCEKSNTLLLRKRNSMWGNFVYSVLWKYTASSAFLGRSWYRYLPIHSTQWGTHVKSGPDGYCCNFRSLVIRSLYPHRWKPTLLAMDSVHRGNRLHPIWQKPRSLIQFLFKSNAHSVCSYEPYLISASSSFSEGDDR